MQREIKPLREQVIVLTGATSGIGLATARLAAKKGARLVLNSRNEEDLRTLAQDLRRRGCEVIHFAADVADSEAMKQLALYAASTFGGIDTWINNAGVSIYGKLTEIHLGEKRRLFDTNFWGVIHGCRAAIPYLRRNGGALINIGSVVSHRAVPYQGIYCASKHAVKGYTDALRMELENDGIPISVSLVIPGSIDTPYTIHAANHLEREPMLPPPVYAPEVAARAILHCASKPVREVFVGGGAKALSALESFAPRLVDQYMKRMMDREHQMLDRPGTRTNALYAPFPRELKLRGNYPGHVSRWSLYTSTVLHPLRSLFALGSLFGGISALSILLGKRSQEQARILEPRSRQPGTAESMAPMPARSETQSTSITKSA